MPESVKGISALGNNLVKATALTQRNVSLEEGVWDDSSPRGCSIPKRGDPQEMRARTQSGEEIVRC